MKNCYIFLIATAFLATTVIEALAQHLLGAEASRIRKDAKELILHHKRHNISFIRPNDLFHVASDAAADWLLADVLKTRLEDGLLPYKKDKDKMGYTHDRYRQHYKGIPVEYGVYYVHSRNNRVESANGEWYDGIDIPVSASLTADEAYDRALNHMASVTRMHEREDVDNRKLMILPHEDRFALVYRCDVYSLEPYGHSYVYIDANSGQVVKEENRIHTGSVYGTAETLYAGTRTIGADSLASNSYRLREYFRGAGVETYDFSNGNADYYDTDNYWVNYNILDVIAFDAHYGAEATYDFYDDFFGYKSVDGAGQNKLISYLHNNGAGAVNAFWDGVAMNYGDGDPQHGIGALTGLDVVAHELTHGVTDYTSNLNYSGESGALNESFSDIAGIVVRFLNQPGVATWLINDLANYPFRDMSNPNVFQCPDTYDGTYWDYGDIVHFNSGVQNFWFYLLTDGGEGVNDVGDHYSVNGLGVVDAAKIAMRNNMVYLTASSDFQDARDYAIQSAIDLFGDCSNQVIQTANAWYAVNVGEPYGNSVNALFGSAQVDYCTVPASVTFINESNNATSYVWDFGDGATSTDVSPVHSYTAEGNYTVTLIANGTATCNTSDTLFMPNYIEVQNIGSPLPALCTPATAGNAGDYGIRRFIFNGIDNSTLNNDEYQDYTCSHFTTVVAGSKYLALAYLNGDIFYENPAEDLRIWLDYDNDGDLESNELVFSDDKDTTAMGGYIKISETAVMNTPLRLRVMDDKYQSDISSSCFSPSAGQCEDYTVIIVESAAAPVADFIATPKTISVGQAVSFTDISENKPTAWSWIFEGGSPATSTVEDPAGIVYPAAGLYDVTLVVSNAFGADTILKENYINVQPVFNFCQFTELPYYEGAFFDPGGVFSKYGVNENCSFLINPACAGPISLLITSFESQATFDVLNVYDGTDATGPLLGSLSGTPAMPVTFTAASGHMYVTWVSDATNSKDGFYAAWSAPEGGTNTPTAGFVASDYSPAYGTTVAFTDLSTELPIYWSWDFGDGTTSTIQNPSHSYAGAGTYTVKLVSTNCGGSDSLTQTIVAQAAPSVEIIPDPVLINVNCGATVVTTATIQNNGGGDLLYNQAESEYYFQGDHPAILSLTYGANLAEEYAHTFHALDLYFPDYDLTATAAQTGDELAAALQGRNTFILTKATGSPPTYSNYATVLNDFVTKGGTVILCGTSQSKSDCLFNTGLIEGSFGTVVSNANLNVLNTNDPLATGLPSLIATSPKNTYSLNITSVDWVEVIEYAGNTVVGYRPLGLGKVIYVGFDYKVDDDDTANLVMGNAVSWVDENLVPDWVTLDPDTGGEIAAGNSQLVTISVNGIGIPDGVYTEYVVVTSNDPINPMVEVPVIITVEGSNCLGIDPSAQCEGNICFDGTVPAGVTSIIWNFGDGAFDTVEDPCHVYESSAAYTVTLIACVGSDCDTLLQPVNVEILQAGITWSGLLLTGEPISFFSNSEFVASWSWDFGDGNISSTENPVHVYTTDGVYDVVLTVMDASGCVYVTSEQIVVLATGMGSFTAHAGVQLYPNPAQGEATVEYTLIENTTVRIELWNCLGQRLAVIVPQQEQIAGTYTQPFELQEAGMFLVKVATGESIYWHKLINTK